MNKPRKYRCVKELLVNTCDDDGHPIENAPMITVPVGGVYEVSTPGLNLDYYLTACGGRWGWLYLNKETFEECFEEVSE